MKKVVASKRGFTIIEVVLVLGIAGLIFLMVFITLPTLQRNSRDAQRREDMMTFISAMKDYQTNNRGTLPATHKDGSTTVLVNSINASTAANSWGGLYRDYFLKANRFTDPKGTKYGLSIAWCTAAKTGGNCTGAASNMITHLQNRTWTKTDILVILQANCNGQTIVGAASPRRAVVAYLLEGGGFYCGEV